MAKDPTCTEADARAAEAERSVSSLFGHRLLGLPFSHLARVSYPAPPVIGRSWNYWWQAHYLDAIVDAGWRRARCGDPDGARGQAHLGLRLLTTIRVRNLGRITNAYYDDMAWLVLAVDRLRRLYDEVLAPNGRTAHRLSSAEDALTDRLRSAVTAHLGGGVFWNTARDFKNVPATGPTAIHLARSGDLGSAHRLVDWMYARLLTTDTGLFVDGIRLTRGGEQVVADVYTYNQGTVLGALLTLGDDISLNRVRELVTAVATHQTVPHATLRPLLTHGGGDGGLFTGILVRYLAQAATHPAVDVGTRSTAGRLVLDTAAALWSDRDERTLGDGRRVTVFSPDAACLAQQAQPPGRVVELSTQVQAWTVLEASAAVAGR